MTTCYYYIKSGNVIDETTRIYCVTVGTSVQANRDFLFLTAYAVQHGHYFEIRSLKSTGFVSRLLQEYIGTLTEPAMTKVTARSLVRALKSGDEIPVPQHVCDNQNHLMTYLSLNYRTAKFCRR